MAVVDLDKAVLSQKLLHDHSECTLYMDDLGTVWLCLWLLFSKFSLAFVIDIGIKIIMGYMWLLFW